MSRLAQTLTTGWRRPPTPRAGLAAWRAARRERVLVDVGPTVGGWVLRVALAVLAAVVLVLSGLTDTAGAGGLRTYLLPLAVLCAVVTVARPGSVAPGALLVVVAVRLLQDAVTVDLRTCALVLAVHLLLRITALAAQAGWRVRVEVALVGAHLREAAVPQLGAQALTLAAAAVVASSGAGAGGSWFRLGAVLAALGVVVVLGLGRWRASGSAGAGSP